MENLPLNTNILVTLLRCLLAFIFSLSPNSFTVQCNIKVREASTTSRWNPEHVTIHMKANEYTFLWYCLLLSRIHTFKVTLNFKSVDEIRKFDHYKVSLFFFFSFKMGKSTMCNHVLLWKPQDKTTPIHCQLELGWPALRSTYSPYIKLV